MYLDEGRLPNDTNNSRHSSADIETPLSPSNILVEDTAGATPLAPPVSVEIHVVPNLSETEGVDEVTELHQATVSACPPSEGTPPNTAESEISTPRRTRRESLATRRRSSVIPGMRRESLVGGKFNNTCVHVFTIGSCL